MQDRPLSPLRRLAAFGLTVLATPPLLAENFADTALSEYDDVRWVGNEAGMIEGENRNAIDRHGDLRWRPVEVDTPLHKLQWFWHPNSDQTLKSVGELVQIWEDSVGRGGQLVLGIAPDKRGLLPEADVKRLEEMGHALQARYGADRNLVRGRLKSDDSIAAAVDGDRDTFWNAPDGSHHATLELQFKQPVTFDTALSMEWLNDGQLVQKYAVEVFRDGAWVKVAQAQAIGHMKIDHFPTVTASRVRLNILSSVDAAHIREFQLFNVGAAAARCSLPAACNRSRAGRCRVRLFSLARYAAFAARASSCRTVVPDAAATHLPSPPGRGVGGEGTAAPGPEARAQPRRSAGMHRVRMPRFVVRRQLRPLAAACARRRTTGPNAAAPAWSRVRRRGHVALA